MFAMHITEFFVIPVYTYLGKTTTTTTKNIKNKKTKTASPTGNHSLESLQG